MFGNIKVKLIVTCNLYSILSCKIILKNCNPNYCNLDDRLDFCIVCHMFDEILMGKITISLKFFAKNACRPITLIYQM